MKKIIVFAVLLFYTANLLKAENPLKVNFGAALRFNYKYTTWNEANKSQYGTMSYDMFRLSTVADYKNILLNAEYRFYSANNGGGMLKRGWIGYRLNDRHTFTIGLTPVPFGLQPYTSNSYFFNINYYVGLEDDDDLGISYTYNYENWNIGVGFFKNSDLLASDGGEQSLNRYSYDIVGDYREINALAVNVAYKLGKVLQSEIGLSALYGNVLNNTSFDKKQRYAFAVYYYGKIDAIELKTQYSIYNNGIEKVEVGAFGASYLIPGQAQTLSACLSYNFAFNDKFIDNIQVYNDYSVMFEKNTTSNLSHQNILGCSLTMGPILCYFDFAFGKNQPWLGNEWSNAFYNGDSGWNTRINLNIGYYFNAKINK